MGISVRSVRPLFVGEVSGVDLCAPVDRETFFELEAALDRYAILIIHDQMLTDEQQITVSRLFGPLETAIGAIRHGRRHRLASRQLVDVSNLDDHNNIRSQSDRWRMFMLANQLWHTDSSFKSVPGKMSLLSAREVPPAGGETEFADLRAAYDALEQATKERVADLVAEHSIFHSRSLVGYGDFSDEERAALPPARRKLVWVHPGSGRKTLYLASHASHIIGWPVEEGRRFLRDLIAFATQPQFVLQHHWRVGDLVIWDNRCTMHRGRPYDDLRHRRDLRRTTIEETYVGHSWREDAGSDLALGRAS